MRSESLLFITTQFVEHDCNYYDKKAGGGDEKVNNLCVAK